MSYNKLLLLTQFILFCNNYDNMTVKALIGNGIEPAEEGIFSSFVCIAHRIPINSDPDQLVICTAVLVSSTHILTAEHCVNEQPAGFQLIVGSTDLSAGLVHHPLWWLTFDRWAAVFEYPRQHIVNDIAVIRVMEPVPAEIFPAMIIYQPNNAYYGREVIMAGWGTGNNGSSPQNLQMSKLTIIPNDECEELVRRLQRTFSRVPQKYMCSVRNPYVLSADGDSGGPILYMNFVIGINEGTCPTMNHTFNPNKANVSNSVHYYRDFLLIAINML